MASVGLVELPAFKLLDGDGLNWTALRQHDPLGSKQILAAHLAAAGHDVTVVNLKAEERDTVVGAVEWNGRTLTKIAVGTPWTELDPSAFDVWGVTVNYLQERDAACAAIRHLARGAKVVVGGSDPFAEPEAVPAGRGRMRWSRDKSGAANDAAIEFVLTGRSTAPLTGVTLPDGRALPVARPPMSPQDWPLPPPAVVSATLGRTYWEAPLPSSLKPVGSVMLDIGCDRHCDFCETPTYRLGYKAMTPDRARQWLAAQRDVGANSVIVLSDQFLGRVLRPGGREEVLEITAAARDLGLALLWGNGLEIKKATLGRSLPGGDDRPDEELVRALWGWDGKVGCAQAYIPAERPVTGTSSYAKLLPWNQHCEMLETIVGTGLPDLNYGVIIGLPDDSPAALEQLLAAVADLKSRLKLINPELRFRVTPYAIRPLPGTPQSAQLNRLGLVRFDDHAITGGFWTACADTRHMPYEQVSEWQVALVDALNDPEEDWQGLTALV